MGYPVIGGPAQVAAHEARVGALEAAAEEKRRALLTEAANAKAEGERLQESASGCEAQLAALERELEASAGPVAAPARPPGGSLP